MKNVILTIIIVLVLIFTIIFPSNATADIPLGDPGIDYFYISPYNDFGTPHTDKLGGEFRTYCGYSHINNDDPTVYPNQPGKSHQHTYFGNTNTDSTSTPLSLRKNGNSTCAGGISNRSAYWVPTMEDSKNEPVLPSEFVVYYKGPGMEPSTIRPLPEGLILIAGDKTATPEHPYLWKGGFACLNSGSPESRHGTPNIPSDCDVGDTIEQYMNFPACWDGLNLDSDDHKSHMAYGIYNSPNEPNGVTASCPTDHPVQLPVITTKTRYKVTADTPNWHLSSDMYDLKTGEGGYTNHANWMGAWDYVVMKTWTVNCLRASKDCHSALLGNGTILNYPWPPYVMPTN